MTPDEFIRLLEKPAELSDGQAEALRELTLRYPYFAPAKALYAKHLHDNDDLRYTAAAEEAALLAPDRAALKRFAENGTTAAASYTLRDIPAGDTVSDAPLRRQDLIDAFLSQGTKPHPTLPDDDAPDHLTYQPAEQRQANDSVLTETLADIYVRQRHYDKALRIFGKLYLKYPEKSAYFASRMQEMRELIKNNE